MRPVITREAIIERREPRMRWSAVVAGAFVALAVWVLLQLFDLGTALSTLDNAEHARSLDVGVWSLISPVIAMFCGGLVAGRLATAGEPGNGAMHGLVVWALAMLVSVVATVWLVALAWVDVHAAGTQTASGQLGAVTIEAARATGDALLWVGVSMLLGLVAAVVGGMAAAQRDRPSARDAIDVPVTPDQPGVPPPPI